jgi:hypothetical protein
MTWNLDLVEHGSFDYEWKVKVLDIESSEIIFKILSVHLSRNTEEFFNLLCLCSFKGSCVQCSITSSCSTHYGVNPVEFWHEIKAVSELFFEVTDDKLRNNLVFKVSLNSVEVCKSLRIKNGFNIENKN